MNVFYLHPDPKKCAQYHNDSHTVKMILESAQLLSTAHHLMNSKPPEGIYKMTHKNHPSAIWARQSKNNYAWLFALFCELMEEYTFRYGKTHKCDAMRQILWNTPDGITSEKWCEPPQAMPDECKVPGNSVAAYRSYYIMNKGHLASWKKRGEPDWINYEKI